MVPPGRKWEIKKIQNQNLQLTKLFFNNVVFFKNLIIYLKKWHLWVLGMENVSEGDNIEREFSASAHPKSIKTKVLSNLHRKKEENLHLLLFLGRFETGRAEENNKSWFQSNNGAVGNNPMNTKEVAIIIKLHRTHKKTTPQ